MRGQRHNTANIIVRESLTQALLLLMEKKDIQDIKISELIKKAGVSRSSFYRNYSSKEEIINDYLIDYCQEYWKKHYKKNDSFSLLLLGFETILSLDSKLILIDKAGLTWLFNRVILTLVRQEDSAHSANNPDNNYLTAVYAAIISSVVKEWVEGGCRETPEELTQIVFKLQLDETIN